MNGRFVKVLVGIFVVGFCVTLIDVFSPITESQARFPIFSLKEAPKAITDGEKSSLASVRESEIELAFESDSLKATSTIDIPLFDGKLYSAEQLKFEGMEDRASNDFTWRGKIRKAEFTGDVVLTFRKGYLTGIIYSPEAVYELVAKGNKQILVQLDQSLFPECGGEVEAPETKNDAAPQNIGTIEDSGDRIDVLVVYTEAVKNALGGDAQAQSVAQSAIDISNTAYLNSKIRQRLRLVHSEETALTEANTLSQLRVDAATQTVRNTHNADIVAMLVNSLGGCGIGYVMTNVGSGFAGSAYSITRRSCAVGNLTFAHELGHNMGSTHNPKNAGSAAFPYSYGHYINGSYRTVMSYSNQCTSGCTRVPRFSNPSLVFNSAATGILDERNNHRSIENTADVVANFRYSGSSLRLDNFSENQFIPRNIERTLNWSSEGLTGNVKIELSRDEGSTWETVSNSTVNDGSHVFKVGGRPTKKARIRVSSLDATSVSDSSIKGISIK